MVKSGKIKILLFSLFILIFNHKYLNLTKMDLSVFENKIFKCSHVKQGTDHTWNASDESGNEAAEVQPDLHQRRGVFITLALQEQPHAFNVLNKRVVQRLHLLTHEASARSNCYRGNESVKCVQKNVSFSLTSK